MNSSGNELSPEERARAIVDDVIARRRAGEILPDDLVLKQHPEILGTLEQLLRKAAFTMSARDQSGSNHQAMPLDALLRDTDAEPKPPSQEAATEGSSLAGGSLPEAIAPRVSWVDVEKEMEGENEVGPEIDRITFEEDLPASSDSSQVADPVVSDESAPAEESSIPIAATGRATIVQSEPDATAVEVPQIYPSPDEPSTVRLDQSGNFGDAVTFRPSCRPPTGVLRVFDDNQDSGELVRIRSASTTIGRQSGDVVVPHDSLMSGEHARIDRELVDGAWNWTLTDLESTNGVYVKARRIRLRDGDQLLIANRTVSFIQGSDGESPELQEIRPDGDGEKLQLRGVDCWLGRDGSVCTPFLATEPTLDARFARLMHRRDGRWTIWTAQSVNGLWIRVERIRLVGGSMFQLGEQRFSFHTP